MLNLCLGTMREMCALLGRKGKGEEEGRGRGQAGKRRGHINTLRHSNHFSPLASVMSSPRVLQSLENTDPPALGASKSPDDGMPALGGDGLQTRTSRRDTADSSDLRDLMVMIDDTDTPKSTLSVRRPKKQDRRSTIDGSELEELMRGIAEGERSSFSSAKADQEKVEEKADAELQTTATEEPTPALDDMDQDPDVPPLAPSPARRQPKRAASLGGSTLKSILNYKKPRMSLPAPNASRSARPRRSRTVAFGSPQAAEFNSGSPSASLTPMPGSEAKQKYAVPDDSMNTTTSTEGTNTPGGHDDEGTEEFEGDLNAMIASATRGEGEDETVELEGDISELLRSAERDPDASRPVEDQPEEDNTVELEVDLNSLLSAVGSSGGDSLRRLSASTGGTVADDVLTSPEALKVSLDATPPPPGPPVIDVTSAEILLHCESDAAQPFATRVNDFRSSLLEAAAAAAGSGRAAVVADDVVTAAREEVSRKAAETAGGGERALEAVAEANPYLLHRVQTAVRSVGGERNAVGEEMKVLYKKVEESVLGEWNMWEVEVCGAMLQRLEEVEKELDEDKEKLDEKLDDVEGQLSKLKSKRGREARVARRVSLERREGEVTALRTDLEDLEAKAAELETELTTVSNSLEAAEAAAETTIALRDTKAESDSTNTKAKDREKKFKTLEGLLLWTPKLVDSNKIIVNFQGIMAETGVSLGFDLNAEAGVQAFMLRNPAGAFPSKAKGKKKAFVFTADARRFADLAVSAIVERMNGPSSTLAGGGDIPAVLQSIEFEIGRIETLAVEMSSIQRAYDSVLEGDAASGFKLAVDFVSRTAAAKLRVVLPLKGYPFAPTDVVLLPLIGKIDSANLAIMLRRGVKPGYGRIKRTCDNVAAYMK